MENSGKNADKFDGLLGKIADRRKELDDKAKLCESVDSSRRELAAAEAFPRKAHASNVPDVVKATSAALHANALHGAEGKTAIGPLGRLQRGVEERAHISAVVAAVAGGVASGPAAASAGGHGSRTA